MARVGGALHTKHCNDVLKVLHAVRYPAVFEVRWSLRESSDLDAAGDDEEARTPVRHQNTRLHSANARPQIISAHDNAAQYDGGSVVWEVEGSSPAHEGHSAAEFIASPGLSCGSIVGYPAASGRASFECCAADEAESLMLQLLAMRRVPRTATHGSKPVDVARPTATNFVASASDASTSHVAEPPRSPLLPPRAPAGPPLAARRAMDVANLGQPAVPGVADKGNLASGLSSEADPHHLPFAHRRDVFEQGRPQSEAACPLASAHDGACPVADDASPSQAAAIPSLNDKFDALLARARHEASHDGACPVADDASPSQAAAIPSLSDKFDALLARGRHEGPRLPREWQRPQSPSRSPARQVNNQESFMPLPRPPQGGSAQASANIANTSGGSCVGGSAIGASSLVGAGSSRTTTIGAVRASSPSLSAHWPSAASSPNHTSPNNSPRSAVGIRSDAAPPSCVPNFVHRTAPGNNEASSSAQQLRGPTASSALVSLIANRDTFWSGGSGGGSSDVGGAFVQLGSSDSTSKSSTPVRPSSKPAHLQLHLSGLGSIAPNVGSGSTSIPASHTGPDQVEALRQKYGLPPSPQCGLPPPSPHASTAWRSLTPREPVAAAACNVDSSATCGGLPPPPPVRGLLGHGAEPAERRGLASGSVAQVSDQQQHQSRQTSITEHCGETPMLSRIQAFRRDVLGTADTAAPAKPSSARFENSTQFRSTSVPSNSCRSAACSGGRGTAPVLSSWHEAIGAAMSIGGAAVAATVAAAQHGGWAPVTPNMHGS